MLDSIIFHVEDFEAMFTRWVDNNQGWVSLLTIVAIAVFIFFNKNNSKNSKHSTTEGGGGYDGGE